MASEPQKEPFRAGEPADKGPGGRPFRQETSLIARLGAQRRAAISDEDPTLAIGGRDLDDDPPGADRPGDDPGEDGPPRARLLPILIALLALAGFGAVVWYAYTWGIGAVGDEELPVIHAEQGPIKSRPESPGGLQVPNQESLVLNNEEPDPNKPQVERLLPPPETPLPPKPQAAAPAEPAAGAGQRPAIAAPVIDVEPKAVEEPSLPPPPSAATQTAAAPEKPATVPAPPGKDTALPAAPAKQTAAPAAPAKQTATPTAPAEQTAALPPAGRFVVQLASLKDKGRVEVTWADLQKAYPGLLGDKRLVVQNVDLGSRGVYHRVQAGTFPDRASAQAFCDRLKARKQDCLVVKR
jgi:cell division septation protein DedD